MQKVRKSLPAGPGPRPVVTRPFSQPGGITGLLPAPPPPPFPVMIKSHFVQTPHNDTTSTATALFLIDTVYTLTTRAY